jgi:hypothetical protein
MILFDKEPYVSYVSPYMLFLEMLLYNLIAARFSQTQLVDNRTKITAILLGDILEATVLVGISGGYNSPFFAVFLFTMAEISLYLSWRSASILIVGINGIQVIITGIQIAAMTDMISRSLIESRFLRLLIVGLLFVILTEILRNEEQNRRVAVQASNQIANLNSIFAQLGQAHMDIQRVFATVLSASNTLDQVRVSLILRKPVQGTVWTIVASSDLARCPLGKELPIPAKFENESFSVNNIDTETKNIFICSQDIPQVILSKLPPFSETEEGMLVVGRSTTDQINEEDLKFLQALAMQTQLRLSDNSISYQTAGVFSRILAD